MVEVIEWGSSGPEVVLVHGDGAGGPATFAAQRALAERFRLRVVNRRGFGNSPDVEGEDFEVDAADVAEVLDDGAHLVGHSYGGVVSLLAAARRPEAVRSLTVVEPPAFGIVADDPVVRAFVTEIRDLLDENPPPEDFLRRFLGLIGGDPASLPDPLPAPVLKAASVQMRGRWPQDAVIPVEALAALDCPKLVVSGGHSALFDAVCDALEERIGALRAVLPGAGHSVPRLGAPFNAALETLWGGPGS
jgi:pimeloyl-ACP methyl ester carboxylesterase